MVESICTSKKVAHNFLRERGKNYNFSFLKIFLLRLDQIERKRGKSFCFCFLCSRRVRAVVVVVKRYKTISRGKRYKTSSKKKKKQKFKINRRKWRI
jgi:hypothetical protein